MKKQLLLVCALILGTILSLQAQAPQAIQYQTIIRNAAGEVVMNQNVGLQLTVRQYTATGTSVYQETHTKMTNDYGLVNLQIGMGTPVSGTLGGVVWSMGPYHLEVGLDLDGNGFTVMGTTQLLSVPYALYATSSGDGIPSGGTEGQVLQIISGVATWVTPGTCSDGIKNQDETGVDCGGTCAECPAVGDVVDDGVVFYLFQDGDAGYVPGEIHGLIVSLDEGVGNWCPDDATDLSIPNVTSSPVAPETAVGARIGDGSSNTDGIISGCASGFAADWCRAKGPEWFLPSRAELNELYKWYDSDKSGINSLTGISDTFYWSSTEIDNFAAWVQFFSDGGQGPSGKAVSRRVRAVRAF